MKTRFLKLTIILLCLGDFTTMQAQGLYNLATLDEDYADSKPLKFTSADESSWNLYHKEDADRRTNWAKYTAGGGVGFGWDDTDGNSETGVCFNIEFLAKVIGGDQNPNGAGYLGAFASQHIANSDNVDESITKAGAKFSYFDRITRHNEVQLIYGAKAFYETGSRDISGFEEDISGYGISAYTGANFKISNRVSVGVEMPVLSYLSRTFEAGGSEFEQDSFTAAVNKDNPVMLTARFTLDNIKKFKFVE